MAIFRLAWIGVIAGVVTSKIQETNKLYADTSENGKDETENENRTEM